MSKVYASEDCWGNLSYKSCFITLISLFLGDCLLILAYIKEFFLAYSIALPVKRALTALMNFNAYDKKPD